MKELLTPELIKYIANCYFWLFIVFFILTSITMSTDLYKEDKINAVKRGIYFNFGDTISMAMLRWMLFFISIKLS
jgi:hypothetical protein